MANKTSERLGNESRSKVRPPSLHKSSYSLFSLKYLGKSLLDASVLSSSVSSSTQEEQWQSKVPERLPALSKPPSKRFLLGSDSGGRSVIIKRRRDDFQQSIKDLGMSYIRAKAKQPFAGVVPFRCVGKLERFLPVDRLFPDPCEVGITVLPAAPTELCPSAKLNSSASTLQAPLSPVRARYEKRPSRIHLSRSVEQVTASPDVPCGPASESPFFELIGECKAYPYLSAEPKAPSRKPSPMRVISPARRDHATCTCSSRQYLTASLHYQQLFLHAPPSAASVQHLPALDLLSIARTQADTRRLVLALVFDGVLGDWGKLCLTDESPLTLRLRGEAVSGLLLLQQHFQLVFISKMPRKQCTSVLSHLVSCGVHFEAAYRLSGGALVGRRYQFLVYERLERDLRIRDMSRRVMILAALMLGREEAEPAAPELLYTRHGTKLYLTAECVPVAVPANSPLPIVCLVPALQMQAEALSFNVIAQAVLSYYEKCDNDWVSGLHCVGESADLCALTTSVVHQVLMSQVLPEPRADCFFSLEQPSHTCSLHERLAWGKGPTIHPFTNRILLLTSRSQEFADLETVETQAASVRTGYINLLDYVQQGAPGKATHNASQHFAESVS